MSEYEILAALKDFQIKLDNHYATLNQSLSQFTNRVVSRIDELSLQIRGSPRTSSGIFSKQFSTPDTLPRYTETVSISMESKLKAKKICLGEINGEQEVEPSQKSLGLNLTGSQVAVPLKAGLGTYSLPIDNLSAEKPFDRCGGDYVEIFVPDIYQLSPRCVEFIGKAGWDFAVGREFCEDDSLGLYVIDDDVHFNVLVADLILGDGKRSLGNLDRETAAYGAVSHSYRTTISLDLKVFDKMTEPEKELFTKMGMVKCCVNENSCEFNFDCHWKERHFVIEQLPRPSPEPPPWQLKIVLRSVGGKNEGLFKPQANTKDGIKEYQKMILSKVKVAMMIPSTSQYDWDQNPAVSKFRADDVLRKIQRTSNIQNKFIKVEEEVIQLQDKHLFSFPWTNDSIWTSGMLRSRVFSRFRNQNFVIVPSADLINHSANVNDDDHAHEDRVPAGLFIWDYRFHFRSLLFLKAADKVEVSKSNDFGEAAYFNIKCGQPFPTALVLYFWQVALGGTDIFRVGFISGSKLWGFVEGSVRCAREEFSCRVFCNSCNSALFGYCSSIKIDERQKEERLLHHIGNGIVIGRLYHGLIMNMVSFVKEALALNFPCVQNGARGLRKFTTSSQDSKQTLQGIGIKVSVMGFCAYSELHLEDKVDFKGDGMTHHHPWDPGGPKTHTDPIEAYPAQAQDQAHSGIINIHLQASKKISRVFFFVFVLRSCTHSKWCIFLSLSFSRSLHLLER